MINIIGKRYYYFLFSALLIIPGLVVLVIWGLPLAIDFTGGSLFEVKFESGFVPQPAEVIAIYEDLGIDDALVQTTGDRMGTTVFTLARTPRSIRARR